jgi:hypothetical protein
MKCDCAEYEEGEKQIRSFTMLAWTHGMRYTATQWKFCPWCGKVLADEDLGTGFAGKFVGQDEGEGEDE